MYSNNVQRRTKEYKKLALFINPIDKLLRSDGRLRNKKLPYDYKYPVILPHDPTLTKRLIEKGHNTTVHFVTNFVGVANEMIKLKKHLRKNMLSYYPFSREFSLQWKFTTECDGLQ